MTKKVLIIGNNCQSWKSWPAKVKWLKDFYAPKVNLEIDLTFSYFSNIPFDDQYNSINKMWFEENLLPLSSEVYDIYLFVVRPSEWKADGYGGFCMCDAYARAEIVCEENNYVAWEDTYRVSDTAFNLFARHELMHCLYGLLKQKDRTHDWPPQQINQALLALDVSVPAQISGLKARLMILLGWLKNQLAQTIMSLPGKEIADKARSLLGTDFTNDNYVSDEVSCAYAVSSILHYVDPQVPIIVSTKDLDDYCKKSILFKRVYEPQAGDIEIAPTGLGTNLNMPHGHVMIYLDNVNGASNDSATGLFTQNYTRQSFRKYYGEKGGYPLRIYRKI